MLDLNELTPIVSVSPELQVDPLVNETPLFVITAVIFLPEVSETTVPDIIELYPNLRGVLEQCIAFSV